MNEKPHSGDPLPENCAIIEVHLRELSQLFDSLDPSPFHEKELDDKAAKYIVASAQDLPSKAPLALLAHVDKPAGLPEEGRIVGDAIRNHFSRETDYSRHELRRLFRRGWTSLIIGLTVLAAGLTASTLISRQMSTSPLAILFAESLLIGGWVAMWRPLETFLYDWWPVLGEKRIYDRLSRLAVRIVYADAAPAARP